MIWPAPIQFLFGRGVPPPIEETSSEGCGCGTHVVVSDGFEVCTGCGLCTRPVFETDAMIIPDKTHTHVMQRYDYMTHLEARIRPIKKQIPFAVYNRIIKVFPYVYQSFFRIAKGRKNFMSYPYVLGKLIKEAGIDDTKLQLKKIKTPCKIADAEFYWSRIMEITPEIYTVMRR